MSDILSDSELNRLAERNKIYEQDGWADEPETELVAELLGDIDGIINSHRALAGERDKRDAEIIASVKADCAAMHSSDHQTIADLEAQVRELTGVLEEMRDCDEGMGSHCAKLLAETLADAELSVVKPRNIAVESFRERAVRAIREKGEEWRRQGERWQQKFSQETNPIIARQDMSDRDGAFNHMSAAFAIIELVESLPLTEQEEKL